MAINKKYLQKNHIAIAKSDKDQLKMFYRDEAELQQIYENLKLTRCTNCGEVGTLIFNGKAYGYTEAQDTPVPRRQRIICNHRKVKNCGCGKSFSLYSSDIVPYLSNFAGTFWKFVLLIIIGLSAASALRKMKLGISRRTASRWLEKIDRSQSKWRSRLADYIPPPEIASEKHNTSRINSPLTSTITHFRKFFFLSNNAFSDFQYFFQQPIFVR
jgi:hypothetical protein